MMTADRHEREAETALRRVEHSDSAQYTVVLTALTHATLAVSRRLAEQTQTRTEEK